MDPIVIGVAITILLIMLIGAYYYYNTGDSSVVPATVPDVPAVPVLPESQYTIVRAGSVGGGGWGVGVGTLQLSKTLQKFYFRDSKLVSVDDETKALGSGRVYNGTTPPAMVIALKPLADAYSFSSIAAPGTGKVTVDGSTLGLTKSGTSNATTFTEGQTMTVYPGSNSQWVISKVN